MNSQSNKYLLVDYNVLFYFHKRFMFASTIWHHARLIPLWERFLSQLLLILIRLRLDFCLQDTYSEFPFIFLARLPHQTSLTSSVDVEDRKTLREALYQGIFHRHRRTIFAVGSFLRMLRSRNSQYNTIRSSSEGEDVDEVR